MDTNTARDRLKALADQIRWEATFLRDTALHADITLDQVGVLGDSVAEIRVHADHLSTVLDDLRIDLKDEAVKDLEN